MRTIRILALEDDLETLDVIMATLKDLEESLLDQASKRDVAVTVFSEYTQVEDYLNKMEKSNFDLVLLDRDCKLGGSFHALDLDKFSKDKIVGISSVPEYNENLRRLGVNRIVDKEYKQLGDFQKRLLAELVSLTSA